MSQSIIRTGKNSLKSLARSAYRSLRAQLLQRIIPQSQMSFPTLAKPAIEVIGFFRSISGIGESARLCAQQLVADGYQVKCTSVEKYFHKPEEIVWDWADANNNCAKENIHCRIYHLNPPMLPTVILQMGINDFQRTYNIGYWAWELEIIPKEWIRALNYMNAIFTPSHFTSRVIQSYSNIPVLTVTHPVTPGKFTENMRTQLEINGDAFLVSSIFSFGSAMERKNPGALIRAFTQAFAPTDNAYLLLKANAGDDSPEKKSLLELIAEHPHIKLIDQHWSRAEILGLIHSSNIYASLHRSEGFGLTIAEAMLLGTVPLVTNWSGNMDFCTAENSFLVASRQIAVNSTHPEFKGLNHAHWADADVNNAAVLLQQAFQQQDLLAEKKLHAMYQMQKCINTHKYQHALQSLAAQTQQSVKIKTPAPARL
jgi:glycosyltransferase involved in cell wall biosynthesis